MNTFYDSSRRCDVKTKNISLIEGETVLGPLAQQTGFGSILRDRLSSLMLPGLPIFENDGQHPLPDDKTCLKFTQGHNVVNVFCIKENGKTGIVCTIEDTTPITRSSDNNWGVDITTGVQVSKGNKQLGLVMFEGEANAGSIYHESVARSTERIGHIRLFDANKSNFKGQVVDVMAECIKSGRPTINNQEVVYEELVSGDDGF